MCPTQIHDHMDQCSFPASLTCNLSLQQGETCFHHPPYLLNCSMIVHMCSGFRIANPYSHGKVLYQLDYNAYVQFFFFAFSFRDYSFSELFRSASSPAPFSEVVSEIYNSARFLCHTLHAN